MLNGFDLNFCQLMYTVDRVRLSLNSQVLSQLLYQLPCPPKQNKFQEIFPYFWARGSLNLTLNHEVQVPLNLKVEIVTPFVWRLSFSFILRFRFLSILKMRFLLVLRLSFLTVLRLRFLSIFSVRLVSTLRLRLHLISTLRILSTLGLGSSEFFKIYHRES